MNFYLINVSKWAFIRLRPFVKLNLLIKLWGI